MENKPNILKAVDFYEIIEDKEHGKILYKNKEKTLCPFMGQSNLKSEVFMANKAYPCNLRCAHFNLLQNDENVVLAHKTCGANHQPFILHGIGIKTQDSTPVDSTKPLMRVAEKTEE